MSAIEGRNLGYELCQKLGLLGTMVKKIVITIETDEVVTIDVTHFMTQDQSDVLSELVDRYELVKKEDGKSN